MQDDRKQPRKHWETVVLTGSSGCLGLATLELLIERDQDVKEVRCLDLAELEPAARGHIELLVDRYNERHGFRKLVRFHTGDIRDLNLVERLLRGADCVIHCASRVEMWHHVGDQDARELESVNVGGTENLLKTCCRLAVAKFVHVSSFEAFIGYHTIYYATESTLYKPRQLIFGPSGTSKRAAERKVREYARNKLAHCNQNTGKESLNAVIIRFTPIYGERDKYFVSPILRLAKHFNGVLQRFTNIWIRQQPIYVGNAAWALVKAKQRMNTDETIAGEEFHITDETPIGDPFEFLEPFLESRDMRVSKRTLPMVPVWCLMVLFLWLRQLVLSLDVFGLWKGRRKSRLEEAIERDQKGETDGNKTNELTTDCKSSSWHELITPQALFFFCNSLFLNRTKASLRLDYEPLFSVEESKRRAFDWYKNRLSL